MITKFLENSNIFSIYTGIIQRNIKITFVQITLITPSSPIIMDGGFENLTKFSAEHIFFPQFFGRNRHVVIFNITLPYFISLDFSFSFFIFCLIDIFSKYK